MLSNVLSSCFFQTPFRSWRDQDFLLCWSRFQQKESQKTELLSRPIGSIATPLTTLSSLRQEICFGPKGKLRSLGLERDLTSAGGQKVPKKPSSSIYTKAKAVELATSETTSTHRWRTVTNCHFWKTSNAWTWQNWVKSIDSNSREHLEEQNFEVSKGS